MSLRTPLGIGVAALSCLLVACPTVGDEKGPAIECGAGDVCNIVGNLVEDTTLTADKTYILRAGIFVGDDADGSTATLTIEPGTTIKGDTSTLTFLSVTRGSKIIAKGTKDAPIIFTSNAAEGSRKPGDWGGLIINGNAPTNKCPDLMACDAEGEGGGGKYGGNDAADSSGTLEYVRVEFGGKQITDDNELNGIAFQGVGSGTEVRHLHIHRSKDDGIEFFGGTVNVKNILLTCVGDDNIDWTDGWSGKAQFIAVRQCEGDGDNGIEADSSKVDTATPRSNPTLSNLTIVGPGAGSKSDYGMLLRRGTAGQIWNTVVANFQETCIGIDGDPTFTQVTDETLVIKNTVIHCPNAVSFCDARQVMDKQDCTTDGLDHSATEQWFTAQASNKIEDPKLTNPSATDLAQLDLTPAADSPALSIGAAPSDAWFDAVDYAGAFAPGENWADWATFPEN